MSKNNIAQQYNSMVASIEDAKIYDGRGEYNLYECNKCNNYKVTLYKDKGVTPFIMRCKCGGDMMHTKSSKQAPPSYVKVYNWVRPNRCKWCVVPKKEGKISPYMDIEEITAGRKKAILMDNNILASNYGLQQIEKIINWVSKWILIKDWMLV